MLFTLVAVGKKRQVMGQVGGDTPLESTVVVSPVRWGATWSDTNERAAHMSSSKSTLRALVILVVMAMIAASCGGGGDVGDDALDDPGLAFPTPDGNLVEDAAPLPTADPTVVAMFAATPTAAPVIQLDPWEARVLTAKSDTGFVPVFNEPEGEAFTLYYDYLEGGRVEYPLVNPTYFGNDLSLLVVQGQPGDDWAKVQLPIRPSGSTAWVQTAFFEWSSHNYHIEIDVSDNWVRVWKGDELVVESGAVMGREEAKTPVVRAYIDEKIPGNNAAYGPWILSIAAFSESLNEFSGGLPKLALHGTNQPELLGEYASSGCIRVPNDIIELIAETVPVGTTVDIIS